MMNKNIILLLFCYFSAAFFSYGQLILLDEPLNNGPGIFYSIGIYDNDIVYTMVRDNNTLQPGVFLSNGTPGERYELLEGTSSRAYFNTNISGDQVRLYHDGNYVVGRDAYASVIATGVYSTYKFNKTKTFLTPENIYQPTALSHRNINLVANDGLVTIDTIQENDVRKLRLHHFKNDGSINNFVMPASFFGEQRPTSFFSWNNKLVFVGEQTGEKDLYEINTLGLQRITQNKVSLPTAFKGVSPSSFLLDDYIYFKGRNGYYTNVVPGPIERNYPVHICYSNGDNDFGSTETEIYNGDDGSLGYKAFSDSNSPSSILGKVEGNLIYYSAGEGSNFYGLPTKENLGIPPPFLDRYNYIQHESKVYILLKHNAEIKLFKTDGTAAGTDGMTLPNFPGTTVQASDYGTIKINNQKLYFMAKYEVSGISRYALLTYTKGDENPVVVLEFPEEISPNINVFYPYNVGFLFKSIDPIIGKERLYTYNIEIRSSIFNNGTFTKTTHSNNTASFTYEGRVYTVTSNATVFDQEDQLKVQLLDTLSAPYMHTIKQLPSSEDKDRVSKMFYALNTLKSTNSHSSTISLGYTDVMFSNQPVVAEDLTVLAFYNDSWTEIIPVSFNETNKTITLSHSFPDEAFLFFKKNGVLSIENNSYSNSIMVYPNPSSDYFVVSATGDVLDKVELYSLLGEKIFSKDDITAKELEVKTDRFSKGIYILKITASQKTISKKLILK